MEKTVDTTINSPYKGKLVNLVLTGDERQKAIQEAVSLPSIQLCIEDVGSLSGACGFGYSCVYANTISWASPTKPLPMERNPRAAFEQLFGDGSAAAERTARLKEDSSILDLILEQAAR